YTTLGTAARRSTTNTIGRLSAFGAISEMKRAVPRASGNDNTSATTAMSTVPVITAAMPNRWTSGCHDWVVKNDHLATPRAWAAWAARNTPTATVMPRTA